MSILDKIIPGPDYGATYDTSQFNQACPDLSFNLTQLPLNPFNPILAQASSISKIPPATPDPVYLPQNDPGGGGGGGSSPPAPSAPTCSQPFQIHSVPSTIIIGEYDVTVCPGTINLIIPSGVGTVTTLPITSLTYCIITVTCSGTNADVSSAAVSFTGTAPTPNVATVNAPSTPFIVTVGVLAPTNQVDQVVTTNITATPNVWVQQPNASAMPFSLPVVYYYNWNIYAA